jgi:oligoendopeptidase F
LFVLELPHPQPGAAREITRAGSEAKHLVSGGASARVRALPNPHRMNTPPVFFSQNESAAANQIPTRDQIAETDKWDLAALYATPADWMREFSDVQSRFAGITQFRGRLAESPSALRDCLEFDKSLDVRMERLRHYASLRCSEDSSDNANLAREAQLASLSTKIAESCSFLSPEIQAIDDTTFEHFLDDDMLAEWILPLKKMRRFRPHTLTEGEERLMALVSVPLWGHSETFGQLTDVDMKFGTVQDEHGVERPLSHGAYSSFLVKRDPALRKAAFHRYYAEYDDHKFTIASSLASSVRADVFRARARNHPSAREAALFADDVPVAVYDNLIASVRANLAPLFRYHELRRRKLGLGEIHHYDTYVPLVPKIGTRVGFDEAVDKVVAALQPLGDDYVRVLADGLRTRRWCDRYENKGKRSGAFSSSSYGNPPYMLMNYKADVFSDIYTLAHEAGHSMHSWFSQRAQLFQNYNYPIFLAEVASTFNEELLTHHLLGTTDDPAMRAYIINRQIDDIRGTVYRQTMFAEFERDIHAIEEAGEPLTLDVFRQTYRRLLDAYFGPDFTIDAELELECLRIPHFYNAFYVYKYATGISAAVALSGKVLAGGAPAVGAYLGFLRSGGSKFPIPTLRDAGVDMASPGPVDATLRLFARRVEELEALL